MAEPQSGCLEEPDDWKELEERFAELGVVGDLPLAFLTHKVEGLPEKHPIMALVRYFQQIGTAALHGYDLALCRQDGSQEGPLEEFQVRLGKLVVDIYGEADLEFETPKIVDVEKAVVHRQWKTSRRYNGSYWWVTVMRREVEGKVRYSVRRTWAEDPELRRLEMLISSIEIRQGASLLAAEEQARQMLRGLISAEQWASYVLNDAFWEKGKSGVRYLVRKNRPTLACRDLSEDSGRPITTLCFHPGGYYSGTWIGTLPPSDEVIAHLLFIRGAEYLFWRQANHHDIDDPASGI